MVQNSFQSQKRLKNYSKNWFFSIFSNYQNNVSGHCGGHYNIKIRHSKYFSRDSIKIESIVFIQFCLPNYPQAPFWRWKFFKTKLEENHGKGYLKKSVSIPFMRTQPTFVYCISTRHQYCGDFPNFTTRCFLYFSSMKTLSNWTTNDSFGLCASRRFWNTPYMLNLIKFLGFRCLGILLMRRI